MKCPVCAAQFLQRLRGNLAVGECGGCGGVWLRRDQLEAYRREHLAEAHTEPPAFEPVRRSPHACTSCSGQMLREGIASGLWFLHCPRCGGFFLQAPLPMPTAKQAWCLTVGPGGDTIDVLWLFSSLDSDLGAE